MGLKLNPLLLGGSTLVPLSNNSKHSLRISASRLSFAYRLFPTAGNMRQWTWSAWVKRGQLGTYQVMFGANNDVSNNDGTYCTIAFGANNQIGVSLFSAWLRLSNQVFRDKHAWMHVVVAYDTPNADAQKRCRMWVNGEEITSWATNTTITQNIQHGMNWNQNHSIGRVNYSAAVGQFDGMIYNMHFIDGQVLDASSFGQINPTTGQWVPKEYTGTYPGNSFWLDFNTDWTPGAVISGWSSNIIYDTPGSYSWTIPSNIYDLQANAWGGGGGGGAGNQPAGGTANQGNPSSFYGGNYIAYGGYGGYNGYSSEGAGGGAGVTSGAGDLTINGGAGVVSSSLQGGQGGAGGNGGAGGSVPGQNVAGLPGGFPGGGGSGAGGYLSSGGGGGGGGGAFIQKLLTKASGQLVPGNAFNLTVGAGGAAGVGAGGSYSKNGGPGANGRVYFTYRTASGGTLQQGLGDRSGRDNHFTGYNLRTDGVWIDNLLDSPEDNIPPVSGSAGGYTDYWGGTVAYNPNQSWGTTNIPIAIPRSGKWFVEGYCLQTSGTAYAGIGMRPAGNVVGVEYIGDRANSYGVIAGPTAITAYTNNTQSGAITNSFTTGAAMAMAVDFDSGKMWVGGGGNGVYSWIGGGNPDAGTNPTFTFNTALDYFFALSMYGNTTHWNAGNFSSNSGWSTLKPTATTFKWFRAGNFVDPPILLPKKHFDTKIWTGNGSIKKIDLEFDPNFVWVKHRSGGGLYSHVLFDTERGSFNLMASNEAQAQVNNVNSVDFGTNLGFTLGSLANVNALGDPFVGWSWDEGALPGFDIIKYVGNGAVDRFIGHNLQRYPFMMIIKCYWGLNEAWYLWHWALAVNGDVGVRHLALNNNGAKSSPGVTLFPRIPDAANIYIGNNNAVNNSTTNYVAYVWAEIPGFSEFGWFNGNARADEGSPFVPCGFRPAYLMIKRTDAAGDWIVYDNKRDASNVVKSAIFPNLPAAEYAAAPQVDFLSNGFKMRTPDGSANLSGAQYIFAAFAEAPYKYANAR